MRRTPVPSARPQSVRADVARADAVTVATLNPMRRIPRMLFLVLALALLPVAGASAQSDDDGVHVDPNSPSGREYNIPVQSARDKARGKSKKSDSSGSGSGSGANSGSSGDDSSGGIFGQG